MCVWVHFEKQHVPREIVKFGVAREWTMLPFFIQFYILDRWELEHLECNLFSGLTCLFALHSIPVGVFISTDISPHTLGSHSRVPCVYVKLHTVGSAI